MLILYIYTYQPIHPLVYLEFIPSCPIPCQGAVESDLPSTLLGGKVAFNARSLSQNDPVAATELMGGKPED